MKRYKRLFCLISRKVALQAGYLHLPITMSLSAWVRPSTLVYVSWRRGYQAA